MPYLALRLAATLVLALAAAPVWAHGINGRLALDDVGQTPVATVAPPAVPAPSLDSSARLEIEPTGSATRRSATGLAEAVGGLLVGAGFVELARTWRRDRRVAMAAATAALILGFVVETTPHLVHHALDPDKGNGCQVLQAAERSHATVGTLDATPAPVRAFLADIPATVFAPTLAAPVPCGRAPPA